MDQVIVLIFTIVAWLCFRGGSFFLEKTYQRWVRIYEAGEETGRIARTWLYVMFLVCMAVSVVFSVAFMTFVQAIAIGNGWTAAIVCCAIWFIAADASVRWFAKERNANKAVKESAGK